MKKTSEGKCVFSKENQCTIYSLRPLICRFYPFELKLGNDKELYVFDFTLECPGVGRGRDFNEEDFERLFELAQERLLKVAAEHQPVPK
jgi:Fe-S-cluster containining protein